MNPRTRVANTLPLPTVPMPLAIPGFVLGESLDCEALAGLFETAPQGVLAVRRGGEFLFANPSCCQALGVEPHEVDRFNLRDFIPAGSLAFSASWLEALPRTGDWLPVRPTFQTPAGRTVTLAGGVRWCQSPIDDPWVLGVFTDVTHHLATQNSLREHEELLALLTAHSPIGVFQTDAHGRLSRTNDRWRRIVSLAHMASPRGVWWQIVHPLDRDCVVAQWESVQRYGHEFQCEFRVNAGKGGERFVRTRITRNPNPGNDLAAYIGASEDITDHVRTEHQLKHAHDKLDLRVKERTAQLEAVNEELLQFAYVVAHDLKAPLRAVSNLSGWLARDYAGRLDPKGSEMMQLLQQRVRHMHSLIDGVLTYTQLGQMRKADTEVDLHEVVNQVIAMLAPPPRVQIRIPQPLPKVQGGNEQLYQLFQNLIDNAIKFCDKPQCVVTVSARRLDSAWEFAVADNGPGIPARYRKIVFGLFQKLPRKDNAGGTGIGLALVKRIVEARGGQVRLTSTEAEGSTFTFTWPDQRGPVRPLV